MSNLNQPIGELQPRLHPGVYAFCTLQKDELIPEDAISWFRESEGISVVLPFEAADRSGLSIGFRAEWITLEVHSDLATVGLTSAVSGVLAKAGISCNIVAGFHHDHLFVPAGGGQEALGILFELQSQLTVG